jgi:hypothetical protein
MFIELIFFFLVRLSSTQCRIKKVALLRETKKLRKKKFKATQSGREREREKKTSEKCTIKRNTND